MSGPEAASNRQRRRVSSGAKKALAPVLALIVALVLGLSFATPIAVLAAPATMTVDSDDSGATVITKVYNKAGGGNNVVDLSASPLTPVRAWEPDPYPTTYNPEPPEATGSTWDTAVTWSFETNAPNADWIWETGNADDPASYDTGDPVEAQLYDATAARNGRVVLFETTFDIPGSPTSATLHIACDNAYEFWVNSGTHIRSATAVGGAGWENSDLKQANVTTSGWTVVVSHDISGDLVIGKNTLYVLAGNEYFDTDDGDTGPGTMYNNPGAVIFHIDIEYEELDFDFGDAPDPNYPTLVASNGAAHIIDPDFFLGLGVDADADGQPNATATGDDLGGSDDEDGVVFTSALVIGGTATVDVTASASGKLDAWVDFTGNGDWADPGEQVFTNEALVAGLNSLSFPVPGTATAGTTFARFRFSSAGGLSYDGLAPDGEVEDYEVENPLTVGGEVYPIDLDNPTASAPWLGLALILAAAAGILLIKRRRAHQA